MLIFFYFVLNFNTLHLIYLQLYYFLIAAFYDLSFIILT